MDEYLKRITSPGRFDYYRRQNLSAIMVTVSVENLKYNFEKNENQWLLIIKEK
jgi:hypothetical protein